MSDESLIAEFLLRASVGYKRLAPNGAHERNDYYAKGVFC